MSIRSKMKFDGGLPVGGRSSGGRPKKLKANLRKSKARKKAEADAEKAEFNRKRVKRRVNEDSQRMSRTPGKRAKEYRADARRQEALDRKYPIKGDESLKRAAAESRRIAQKVEAGKGMSRSAVRVSKDAGSKFISDANRKVIEARKKLAKTPRYGGKGRFSSGTRNRFVTDVD